MTNEGRQELLDKVKKITEDVIALNIHLDINLESKSERAIIRHIERIVGELKRLEQRIFFKVIK